MVVKYKSYPCHVPVLDSLGFLSVEWQEYFDRDNVDTNSEQTLTNKIIVDFVNYIFGTSNQIIVTDSGSQTVTLSTPQNIALDSYVQHGRLWLGAGSTYESFYNKDGDLYSEGKCYFQGINSRAEEFGIGYQLLKHEPSANLFYLDINATFTVATALIEKAGQTFITDGIEPGMTLVLLSGVDATSKDFLGACGEVLDLTEETITISVAAAGTETILDLTGVNFVAYDHPIALFLDNGDIHFTIGPNPDARMHIESPTGAGEKAVDLMLHAGVDGHEGFHLNFMANGYNQADAMNVSYFTGDTQPADVLFPMHLNIDDTAAVNADSSTIISLIRGDTAGQSTAETNMIEAGQNFTNLLKLDGATFIDPDYGYENTAGTSVDRVNSGGGGNDAFVNTAVNVELYDNNGDYTLYGSDNTFEMLNCVYSIPAGKSIAPLFYYSKAGGNWTLLPGVSDSTNGCQNTGFISFAAPGDWTKDDEDMNGNAITDAYYLAVVRSTVGLPDKPTESYFKTASTQTTAMLIRGDGSWKPPTIADADAINDSVYNSSTQSKMVYKDSGGGINAFY